MATVPNYGEAALLNDGERQDFVGGINQVMIYQIKGRPMFAWGDIYLDQGQSVIADSTALLWLDGAIDVGTECTGGCCVAYLRGCSGEPCCFNRYTGTGPSQKVSITTDLPGDVMAFGVTPKNGWVFTFDAFIAGSSNLTVSTRFSSCCACECADEAPFLTKVTTSKDMGVVLAGGYGMIERHDIPEGEVLMVSRGLFFAAHESTTMEVGLAGGCTNLCCTGGGIVFKFYGPSAVYTTSKNPVQLLRDFGVPGGRKSALKYKICLKILCAIAEIPFKVAASGGGKGGGGGGN